ncbi:MAG: hotdog domain-containing protein, partial [Cyclobacteriaceae bacterium]
MYRSETFLRVRYGETDQMGYVYYGNYASYFEVARVESLRQLGMTYKELEEMGVMMPVL